MAMLDDILAAKQTRIDQLKRDPGQAAVESSATRAPQPLDFRAALQRPDRTIALMAEIKRASPSKGDIKPDLDAGRAAVAYEEGGASALSVLTDDHFKGDIEDLCEVRSVSGLPLLRKDFISDPIQIFEARACGADAILLIVKILEPTRLIELKSLTESLGMVALVEVWDDDTLKRAIDVGAAVIGVNNRDLGSIDHLHDPVDLSQGERLIRELPDDVTTVAMSGVTSPADVGRLGAAGFDAVLVGEYLSRQPDPVGAARELSSFPRIHSSARV